MLIFFVDRRSKPASRRQSVGLGAGIKQNHQAGLQLGAPEQRERRPARLPPQPRLVSSGHYKLCGRVYFKDFFTASQSVAEGKCFGREGHFTNFGGAEQAAPSRVGICHDRAEMDRTGSRRIEQKPGRAGHGRAGPGSARQGGTGQDRTC